MLPTSDLTGCTEAISHCLNLQNDQAKLEDRDDSTGVQAHLKIMSDLHHRWVNLGGHPICLPVLTNTVCETSNSDIKGFHPTIKRTYLSHPVYYLNILYSTLIVVCITILLIILKVKLLK